MPRRPNVSVIMPTFNQYDFLPAALKALEAQRYKDYELIIVNDGSTDDTTDFLEIFVGTDQPGLPRVHVIHQENAGAAQAINAGTAIARGNWWTWISSDNEQYPDYLDKLVAVAESDQAIGAVFSDYDREENGRTGPEKISNDPRPGYKLGQLIQTLNCFFGPSFLIKKQVWRAAGPHTGKISHDYGHWLRVEEVCMVNGKKIAYLPEQLCLYKAHPERATVTMKADFDAHWHQEQAAKRRQAGTGTCLREVK